MTDNHHKRRFVTSSADAEDIITNLPEDLINPILERLPIKDAVRTSVLSKKWRYRWTTMRTLDLRFQFSNQFLKIGAYRHHGFIRVVNQIMIKHQGPISKFVLHIPKEIVLDSFQEVDLWMLILSRKSVKELNIINQNRMYSIPSCVFACLELRKLHLYNCIFNPPLEFQGFPNLEDIYFKRFSMGDNLGQTVFNLPQLKKLKLYGCCDVNNFNINAMLLRLLHSKQLYAVCIRLSKPIEDSLRVERFNLALMSSNLPNIVLAAEKFPNRLPHAVKCLRQLEFQRFSTGDLDQVQGALCMLRNSPNLKTLHMTHMQMGPDADLELTSNYLESHDSLQNLCMLQSVEMTSIEGSRPELLFIKLLLDHSPRLENMIIRPSATVDAEKRLNIGKDVMLFPRASSKAKMVYLDSVVVT
ncbi:putative F-box domain, FBD domain, leucine-rich repeat domain superfamily [Helianthus annuus]|nr:putative F-box domain, FBD domain, leucine-rich repeat domain superfamily [Helianthus annuus]